jgi:protein-S-isoprenylcysteine O-methyltransferase Ste14
MFARRQLLYLAAAAALGATKMTAKQRVDRALKGQDVDRTPFSFWHHFGLEKLPAERHAQATLEFHRQFHTDLVKVMSDYAFPKPAGNWYELKVVSNPFPEQLRALGLIRDGLRGDAFFVETIFNPWNVAEKLSSPEEVLRLKAENPKTLEAALEAIAESEVSHARKAVAAGAAGIFLAIANAQDGILTQEDYAKFSEPFDRMILQAVAGAPLNILHLHGDKVYLDRFVKGWPAAAINYSNFGTGKPVAAMRALYDGADERAGRAEFPPAVRSGSAEPMAGCARGRREKIRPHARMLGPQRFHHRRTDAANEGHRGVSSSLRAASDKSWARSRVRRTFAVLGSALFLLLAPGIVAGWVPWWISRWRMEAPLLGWLPLRFFGCLLIGAGLPVLVDSFARFAFQGLGTPAPVFPTRHLVVTGLYRHVRNPMYVAVVAVILGQGLLLGNVSVLWYTVLVWLVFHLFVLAYEEPTLRATFATEYDAFRANVPRWVPRLRPWRGSANRGT